MAVKNYPVAQTKEAQAASADLKAQAENNQAAKEQEKTLALSLVTTGAGAAPVPVDMSKFERRNLPVMIKPDDMPVGSALEAEIIDVVKSPVSTIKGNLLWLKHSNGTEFTFPATGTIRSALAPGLKDDDATLLKNLQEFKGRTLLIRRLPNKPSKYKKEMFMFEVFVSKAADAKGKK